MKKTLVSLLIVLILSACAKEPSDYPPPMLTPADVFSAANVFLTDKEIDVAEYRLEMLGFNYVKRTWHLQFEGNSGVLHDYYWLVVDDDNINEISLSGR